MRRPPPLPVIRVEMRRQGGWQVALPDTMVTCEMLDDARRVAYLAAAHCQPCELVVHDAYHHVILDEHLPGDREPRPSTTAEACC